MEDKLKEELKKIGIESYQQGVRDGTEVAIDTYTKALIETITELSPKLNALLQRKS